MPVEALEVSPLIIVRMFRYSSNFSKVWRHVFPAHKNASVHVEMKFNVGTNLGFGCVRYCEISGAKADGSKFINFPSSTFS